VRHTRLRVCVRVHTCACACSCICMRASVCMCVCVCVLRFFTALWTERHHAYTRTCTHTSTRYSHKHTHTHTHNRTHILSLTQVEVPGPERIVEVRRRALNSQYRSAGTLKGTLKLAYIMCSAENSGANNRKAGGNHQGSTG
jgi:hypothetical protein